MVQICPVKEERSSDMPSYGREMDRYVQLRKRDGKICPVKEERWPDMSS